MSLLNPLTKSKHSSSLVIWELPIQRLHEALAVHLQLTRQRASAEGILLLQTSLMIHKCKLIWTVPPLIMVINDIWSSCLLLKIFHATIHIWQRLLFVMMKEWHSWSDEISAGQSSLSSAWLMLLWLWWLNYHQELVCPVPDSSMMPLEQHSSQLQPTHLSIPRWIP